ncbi:hypothetical protein [Novosphingobium album (ex Liu et al. 2023)]|uniref:DUF2147 domain-containing protein n=1 Tax=Novosphingobium album (ex Liu et al. 2023) TaxID=3031130 RepID=A0ABT5WQR0_9SPHN|nr:hypothetical protein [Novosphingobium album (ex Liu et al. 2023)]MDE8652385.1 hypothetical protein [Novosphingobium album (ex Liu et al. 2023)]
MSVSSHSRSRLSITSREGAGLLAVALALLAVAPPGAAATGGSPYYGRWTVADDEAVFSSRGVLYKSIDIAPCGKDFCGVSVGEGGACGPTLFRFLTRHKDGETRLSGHGKWGKAVKNIEIDFYREESIPGGRMLDLNLGDGHDFTGRDGSMPKYSASYRPVGEPRCTAR